VNLKKSNNTQKNILPANRYIRGSFNAQLTNENEQFYNFECNNKENKQYILEFSSNSLDIELNFNDNKNIKENISFGGVHKYYISPSKNKCSISIAHINKKTKDKKIPLDRINYILRLNENKGDKNETFLEKDFTIDHLIDECDNYCDFKLTLKNKNNKTITNGNYSYYFRLFSKDDIIDNEVLNTTAKIENNKDKLADKFEQLISYEPNGQISLNFTNLKVNKTYITTVFIIEKINNEEENYYSFLHEFTTNSKKKDRNENEKIIILSIIISFCVIVVLVIVFIIIYEKLWKKNKDLSEKVLAISFSKGINDDFDQKKSKTDEDYDTTFI
jgi:hypothetical protein